jgi:teichoic acid transport system ATP-binding protein
LPEIRIHVDPDVLLVSHLLDEVRETCTRARWLAEGLVVHDGPAAEVMEAYQA